MPRYHAVISVSNLSKHFKVPVREAGLKQAVVSLFHRKYSLVKAVDEISFEIQPGEVVGFLGPNGAGKTTTLKMLSGLLYPTSGKVNVLGFEPSRRARDFLQQITLVMGNRQQLVGDLPAIDSFDLQRAVYGIPDEQFRLTRDELVNMLELKDLLHKPVRNLSLGERMKMETVGALLHRPKVLFLDEPTLGLDVTMQRRIRSFVEEYNRRYRATVLLTSHYMADVEALCKRVIVIHHGKILFDGVAIVWPIPFWLNLWSGVTPPAWWTTLMQPVELLFFALFFLYLYFLARKQSSDLSFLGKLRFWTGSFAVYCVPGLGIYPLEGFPDHFWGGLLAVFRISDWGCDQDACYDLTHAQDGSG